MENFFFSIIIHNTIRFWKVHPIPYPCRIFFSDHLFWLCSSPFFKHVGQKYPKLSLSVCSRIKFFTHKNKNVPLNISRNVSRIKSILSLSYSDKKERLKKKLIVEKFYQELMKWPVLIVMQTIATSAMKILRHLCSSRTFVNREGCKPKLLQEPIVREVSTHEFLVLLSFLMSAR